MEEGSLSRPGAAEMMHLQLEVATNTSYVRRKYRYRHIAAAEYTVPAAADSAGMYSVRRAMPHMMRARERATCHLG